VAIWAAESRRHWFWRALAVWLCAAAMLPIGAEEPALVFCLSLPAIAVAVRTILWLASPPRQAACQTPPVQAKTQFTLRDLTAAVTLWTLWLGVAVLAMRRLTLVDDSGRGRSALDIVVPAAAMIPTACLAWLVVRGRRRFWSSLGLAGSVLVGTWAMWPRVVWLWRLWFEHEFFDILIFGKLGPAAYRLGWSVTLVGWSVLAALVGLITWLCFVEGNRTRARGVLRGATLFVLTVGLGFLYGQMLWLTPFPPHVACVPNHFDRISQIAAQVRAIHETTPPAGEGKASARTTNQALRPLLDELLPLLEAPSALTADLSWPEVRLARERTLSEATQSARSLIKALGEETQTAAQNGEVDRAAQLAVALIHLGSSYNRNGLMLEAVIAQACLRRGLGELAELRSRVSPPTARALLHKLRPLEGAWEPASTIIQRDMAYCQRMYGWPCRLDHLRHRLTVGPPTCWENFARFVRYREALLAIHRLMQVDLAIRLFLHEHGRLPANLEELAASGLSPIPPDPFTGRPLIYRPSADGQFTLYSTGHDRKDHGGRFGGFDTFLNAEGYDLDLDALTRR
jgi:hypothetical protein